MDTPASDPVARLIAEIETIPAARWDALAGGDPCVGHAFLSLLETSESVGEGTGWDPLHVVVERDGEPLAFAPTYLKSHSQGEYVFDHGWADAFERAGGAYYPKLQVASPFTPCPGRRLLGDDRTTLIAALEAVTRQNQLSSAHATFIEDEDRAAFADRGWLIREGLQFHWFNRDYADFDAFLDALSSRKRKAIRKERSRAVEGLEIEELRGSDIGDEAIAAMWAFYQDTGHRKWGRPYLTRAFFEGVVEALGDALLLFLAREDGVPVAGALNLVGSDELYGRYWGTLVDRPGLHFELSYYRAIDWAIREGKAVVQAGAQGEHKLARGYEPVRTFSAHYLPDPGFRAAVAQFLDSERAAVAQEIEWAREALPYKAG
ncbi:GNAT family N-acetyltransferase [Sphingomicrobium sp. XHP0239]|uniref:GNAT family N-acetyltransferase n=1 Tax=Sphingomicrobium maritimum TaxID=3133972 RepID=UPI0031CC94B1